MKWLAIALGCLASVCVAGCGDKSRSGGAFLPATTAAGQSPGAGSGSGSTAPSGPATIPAIPDLRVALQGTPLPLASGEPLSLLGTVTAEPTSRPLQSAWSQVSGPGATSFGDANALETSATFSEPGLYALRLDVTGADGSLGWAELEVEVNQAPTLVVSAQAPTVAANLRLALQAQLSDDGLPRQTGGVAFLPDVSAVLTAKCAGCHAGARPAATAAFPLADPPVNPADFDQLRARIDLQDPDASLLLLKSQNDPGAAPHGGGAVLAPSSPELATLRAWVEQGAPFEPPAVAFDSEIYPFLAANCTVCHSNGAGGFVINADLAATYDQVLARIDFADPVTSPLVLKPSADGVTHRGLADPIVGFEVGSANHTLFLQWVVTGAPRARGVGQPQPAALALRWEQVDGPGRAVFGDAASASPLAAFDTPGTYTLRAVASDGHLTTESLLVVEVTAVQQLAQFPARAFLEQFPDGEETAEAYYQTIDPLGQRTTFGDWLRANGFGQEPDEEAIYFNQGDLGFGRRMIMERLPGGGVAYSTTNYANIDDALVDRDRIAAVTMEYSPGPNGGPAFTKFYVYDGDGNRVTGADLDGGGFKYLPGLCITCHGGTQGTVADGVYSNGGDIGARFLPFDLNAFGFADEAGFRRQDQEADFRELNRNLLATHVSDATQELIEGWHGGAGLPLPTQQSDFVPQGWIEHPELYRDVVAKSCRTCHVRLDAPLDFASFDSLVGFGAELAKELELRTMPDSRVTYENFWSSPQPALLEAALNLPAKTVSLTVPVSAVLAERTSSGNVNRAVSVRNDFYDLALTQRVGLTDMIDSTRATLEDTQARRRLLQQQGTDVARIRRFQLDAAIQELRDRERRLAGNLARLENRVGQEATLAQDLARLGQDLTRLADQAAPGLAPNGVVSLNRPGRRREQRIQDFLQRVDDLLRNQPGRVRDVFRARDAVRDAANPVFPPEGR